ncbi:unnamed protein product [Calicophoron daubneyi]|uniref:Major facilitator superfamily (MFS) profile domain-containing protein n=1 Tax=Calicophoron daubneyi TaxID=300641 RepID=A0AAV2TRI7_CALDB
MMGCKLAFIFTAITLGTSFQFGYHTGVINQPLNLISDFIRDVTISRGGSQDDAYTTTMVSICVTTWLVGGMIGGIFGGFIANKFGRKRSIIYLSFPCLLGCLLMMTCKVAGSFEMLIVGRLFVGLACGAYTAVGPMYLAELAHPSSRGAAGVLNQLVTAGSLLFSQVLAMPIVMSTEQLWPILLGLSCIPCVISVVCLLFCPESPRYLFLIKNDPVSAQEVLLRLRGPSSDVQAELDGMSRESEAVTRKARVLDLWHVPHLRLALVIAIVAQMGQQLSGINGIFYYSVKLFESNGLSPDQANYASIGTGGALFLITLVSIFIIDRTGRRVLLIGGLIVAFFCLIIFTGCMIGKTLGEVQWPAYVAIVVIYVFVCGFGIGAEIYWHLFVCALYYHTRIRDWFPDCLSTGN